MYPDQEKNKARQVAYQLASQGFDIWFDENSILPGQIVEKQVSQAMDNSAVAILLLAHDEMSTFMKKEVDGFLKKATVKDEDYVPVIPVLIGDAVLPEILKDIMYVRFEDDALIDKLKSSLNSILD
ncbi:toll/interleukin-1 receptor domain-containing protein [Klebsiella quasipneumoniae]